MLLNNQQITEEIKKEIKICIETNQNEKTTQNLWNTVKAVLRGKFIAILAYLKKQEKSQINNLTLHLKQLEKEEIKNPHFHFSLSCIGEGNGNPVQCSCLENLRDGEA